MPRQHKTKKQAAVKMRTTANPSHSPKRSSPMPTSTTTHHKPGRNPSTAARVDVPQAPPSRVDYISSNHPNPTTLQQWLWNPANDPRVKLASAEAKLDPDGPAKVANDLIWSAPLTVTINGNAWKITQGAQSPAAPRAFAFFRAINVYRRQDNAAEAAALAADQRLADLQQQQDGHHAD